MDQKGGNSIHLGPGRGWNVCGSSLISVCNFVVDNQVLLTFITSLYHYELNVTSILSIGMYMSTLYCVIEVMVIVY